MLLIENADVYAPEARGNCCLLLSEGRIAGIFPSDKRGELKQALGVLNEGYRVLDAKNGMTVPGIVDRHVHFNGAGGEGGPAYRTPPLQLSSFIRAGVTSAVGMLGTDGTCRSLRELLMKARALEEEGISTWILTGSYRIPSVTLTGGIMDDLCLIDKVIGLKIAVSDHRSSHPSVEEIRRAVSDARTGGLLAGKPGTVCVHMGAEESSFRPLLEALEGTDVPLTQFGPTHVSRNERLIEEAVEYGKRGGNLDITAVPASKSQSETSTRQVLKHMLEKGVDPKRITLSSDGNGSMPRFDKDGKFAGMGVGPIDAVLECVAEFLEDPEITPDTALGVATSHVAEQLDLKGKGRIAAGADADILILDEKRRLRHVIAKGRMMMEDGEVLAKGTFE